MKSVFGYIEEHGQDLVESLRGFVSCPSVSAEGRGIESAASFLEAGLRKLGFEIRRLVVGASPPIVLARLDAGTGRSLLFYNHYDVQPADPLEEWTGDPFVLRSQGGKLYGRGTADNKGDLVARLGAVEALQQVRGDLPVGIVFLVEGDEEIGSPNLAEAVSLIPHDITADGCVWEGGMRIAGGEPLVSLGVKGLCYVELEARGARRDLHSSLGTFVPNPAWRLVWALASLKNLGEEITIGGFMDDVRPLTARERELVDGIPTDDDALASGLGLKEFLLGMRGSERLQRHCGMPTADICGLVAGYTGRGMKTVLPSRAVAKLGFRLVPEQDPHDILRKLRRHLAGAGFSDIEVRLLSAEGPYRTSPDSPIARTAIETAREIYGCEPAVEPSTGGTGPMATLCGTLGIASVSVGVGYHLSGEHGPDEHIRLDDFLLGAKHIALLIERFGQNAGSGKMLDSFTTVK